MAQAGAVALHRFAWVTAAFAFFVIFAGAMVTSTDSGMAVPDWPTSFGGWWPEMVGGVFYEHGHRTVAAIAGLLTVILALWSAAREERRWARWIAWSALIAVIVQGALGGLTVMLGTHFGWDRTSPLVSTLHASLAQAFFSLLIAFAVVTDGRWQQKKAFKPSKAWMLSASRGLVALVYLQIVLGAVMRHQEAGLIIYDFPLSYGKLVPDFHSWLVGLNYSHRLGGFAVAIGALGLAISALREPSTDAWIRPAAWAVATAVLIQFTLGAFTVWTGLNPVVASLHVIGGAAVLVSSLTLALRLDRCSRAAA